MHMGCSVKARPLVQVHAGFRSTVERFKPLKGGKQIFVSDSPYKTFKVNVASINLMAIMDGVLEARTEHENSRC